MSSFADISRWLWLYGELCVHNILLDDFFGKASAPRRAGPFCLGFACSIARSEASGQVRAGQNRGQGAEKTFTYLHDFFSPFRAVGRGGLRASGQSFPASD